MKTRIVAGLVASLALLTSVSAEAAPKKHATKHASVVTAKAADAKPPKAKAPAPKPAAATKATSATKPASVVTATTSATRPASVVTATTPSTKRKVHKHKKKHAAAGATQPASLVTETTAPKPSPRHSARPASLVTPSAGDAEPAHCKLPQGDKLHPGDQPHHSKLATPKASRFLASGVPLAETHDGRIQAVGSAKHPCGVKSRWAKKNSEWTALDEWGQRVPDGGATIADSRFEGGSGCYEVQLKTECTAPDAARLYVASGSGYSPGAPAKWNAEAAVMKRFDHLYAAQDSAWVEGRGDKSAEGEHGRTLFFSLPKQEGSVEGAATQRRPTHWAVAGGRVLVVGYVGATGTWKVGHVLPPNGKNHAYEPLAILDMNGDGLPEIVVHEEAGGVYVDRVLSFDPGTMRWEKAVESPGGATN